MKLFHDLSFETLVHDGEQYVARVEAAGKHVFDLPEEVGKKLLGTAGWHHFTGEAAKVADEAAKVAAEWLPRVEALEARVAELADELAKALAAIAPKAAAAKTAAK
jgi:uncharacterized protein YceH (UPF0502 family)